MGLGVSGRRFFVRPSLRIWKWWWKSNPELKSRADAIQSSLAEGVDVAISAWVSDERNRVSSQELREEEEELHRGLLRDTNVQDLDA